MNQLKCLGSLSPYCKGEHNCPGYLLELDDAKILLDCGFGITRNMNMPEDLENLTIIISHYHKDHYASLFAIGYASFCYNRLGLLKNKVKVYIPMVKEGEDGYDDYKLIMNFKESYFDIETYDDNSILNINDNKISILEVSHSIKSYSCKIENTNLKIVYSGDMGYKNINKYVEFCKNADCFICESTYLDSDNINDDNHLHARESASIALLSNVNLLILTHFWPEHNKEDYYNEAKSIFDKTIIANENNLINL